MSDLMVSYAQNHEDVLLDRLFPRDHKGVYIDVGANHPTRCSVTKHFYDLGWSGVNIEPAAVFEVLAAQRPRDVNLQVAVSAEDGEATYYEFLAGFSTDSTLDAQVAHENERFTQNCRPRKARVRSLRSICAEHIGARTIDFLSIDVEGHEEQVICGADWKTYRPRVVLVESTRPHSRELNDLRWEPQLLAADYHFAAFDGLNRYYVRGEDKAFLKKLATPVCSFDEYVSVVQMYHRYPQLLMKGLPPDLQLLDGETLGQVCLHWFKRRYPTTARLVRRVLRRGA